MAMDIPARTAVLARTRYFSRIPEEGLERIARVCENRRFQGGETIIRAGSEGAEMFLIDRGTVEVLTTTKSTGSERLLAVLGPGDCFGEVALLSDRVRTADVRARGPVDALVLTREDFRLLMLHVPVVAVSVAQVLAAWLYEANLSAGHRHVRLHDFPVQPEVVRLLSARTMQAHHCVALRQDGQRITVGMVDPLDILALDAIRAEIGHVPIEIVVIRRADLDRFRAKVMPTVRAKDDPWFG